MIVILGLVVLIAGVAGVLANGGHAHAAPADQAAAVPAGASAPAD